MMYIIPMPNSSSGVLCWIENEYVMVNMHLKKVKKRIVDKSVKIHEPRQPNRVVP